MSVKRETCLLSDIITLGEMAVNELQVFEYCTSGLWMRRIFSFSLYHSPMFLMEFHPFTEGNRSPKVNPDQWFQGRAWSRRELAYRIWRRLLYVWPEFYVSMRSLIISVLSCVSLTFSAYVAASPPSPPPCQAHGLNINLNWIRVQRKLSSGASGFSFFLLMKGHTRNRESKINLGSSFKGKCKPFNKLFSTDNWQIV